MNWVSKIFKVIERVSLNTKGIYIFNEALKILRQEFVEPIYDEIFSLIIKLLELFKKKELSNP